MVPQETHTLYLPPPLVPATASPLLVSGFACSGHFVERASHNDLLGLASQCDGSDVPHVWRVSVPSPLCG